MCRYIDRYACMYSETNLYMRPLWERCSRWQSSKRLSFANSWKEKQRQRLWKNNWSEKRKPFLFRQIFLFLLKGGSLWVFSIHYLSHETLIRECTYTGEGVLPGVKKRSMASSLLLLVDSLVHRCSPRIRKHSMETLVTLLSGDICIMLRTNT